MDVEAGAYVDGEYRLSELEEAPATTHISVNPYHWQRHFDNEDRADDFLEAIFDAMNETIKRDFGINLTARTHLKLILEKK